MEDTTASEEATATKCGRVVRPPSGVRIIVDEDCNN